jgi:SAM-dependent methyltransferase
MKNHLPENHPGHRLDFACPACKAPLEIFDEHSFACPADGGKFYREDGIWRFLSAERKSYFDRFMQEYALIRQREGRGSENPEYYRALPYSDLTGRWAGDWRIRAISFGTFITRFLNDFENQHPGPLKIIDMGAGNGWLSNRLAGRGHNLVALDLQVNLVDGLGAFQYYETEFTAAQAEFERLPFSPRQFDLIIFNSSFHYSTNYRAVLQESICALKDTGRVIILDSPIYHQPESGMRMVAERSAEFSARFGFPSDAIPSQNFLTKDQIDVLGSEIGMSWQVLEPNYGWRWALRPWLAALRHKREPATFSILVGKKFLN